MLWLLRIQQQFLQVYQIFINWITYGDYKNFDSVRFDDELKYVLAKEKIMSCIKFDEMFLRILPTCSPKK